MKWHSCNIHGRHGSGLRDVQQINLSLFHPLIIFLFSDHHPGFPFVVLIIIHRVSNQPMGSKPQLSPPASPSGLAFLCSLLVAFMSVVCVMSVVCHRAVVLLLLCFPSFFPLDPLRLRHAPSHWPWMSSHHPLRVDGLVLGFIKCIMCNTAMLYVVVCVTCWCSSETSTWMRGATL